jgi:hypothetical protein
VDATSGANAEASGGEGEEIRTTVDLIDSPCRLFRRHERRSAEREPVRRDGLALEKAREPEVEHLDAQFASGGGQASPTRRRNGRRAVGFVAEQKKVLGLEIAVHDAR